MIGNELESLLHVAIDGGMHLTLPIGKIDRRTGWQRDAPDIGSVLGHLEKGETVGVIPKSVNKLCIDIDSDGAGSRLSTLPRAASERARAAVEAAFGKPATAYQSSSRGHWHLWYDCDGQRADSVGISTRAEWSIEGAGGEAIYGRAYAVVPRAALDAVLPVIADTGTAHRIDVDALAAALSGESGAALTVPDTHSELCAMIRALPVGQRDDGANALLYAYWSTAATERSDGERAAEEAALLSVFGKGARSQVSKLLHRSYGQARKTQDADFAAVNELLVDAARGGFTQDAAGLAGALVQLGIEARYNERKQTAEVDEGEGWQSEGDLVRSHLIERIADECKTENRKGSLRFSEARWRSAFGAIVHRRRCDPFRDWLLSLPPPSPSAPSLDGLLEAVYVTEDALASMYQWASRFLFLGAVWRTMQPGCELQEVPVLIGAQDIGKTALVKALLPDIDWFGDGLNMGDTTQRRVESLLGKVIVHASEMAGTRKADQESMKAWITQTDDGNVRLPYDRRPVALPRRCIIVGTANEQPLPSDPSGNRRFVSLPVQARGQPGECVGKVVLPYIEQYRIEFWAQALALYRRGAVARLPPELKTLQGAVNERFRYRDPLEDRIEDWLESDAPDDGFPIAEAIIGAGLADISRSPTRQDQQAVAKVLRLRRCERRRVLRHGKQQWLWFLP